MASYFICFGLSLAYLLIEIMEAKEVKNEY